MTDGKQAALDFLQAQVKELDALLAQATKDLNTVAGAERVAKWKVRVVPLLAQQVGQEEARRFADIKTGPSFTNDLLEELGDDVEVYREFLMGLAEQIKKASSPMLRDE
ncbi:MAG: hypothetical protein FJ246_07270 [Nitrospira sp.]|nr:hypothetical protein [Nitrospira sp.]